MLEEENKHWGTWSGFPADIPDPCAWMPRGQRVPPHYWGHRKAHFLVRTSMIFGVDVHDPKGCGKTLYKKVKMFALIFLS